MSEEIELREVIAIFRKRMAMILALSMIGVIAAYVVSAFVLKPIYSSSTQLIVNSKKQEQNVPLTFSDLQISLNLIETYKEVIVSPRILEKAIARGALPFSADQLQKKIRVNTVKQSQVISITVEDTTPERAAAIANIVAQTFQEEVPSIMNVDNVQILAEAKPNPLPVKPKTALNVALAAFFGLLIGMVAAFLIETLDQTFKREEDVEAVLGLSVLGSIGYIDADRSRSSGRTSYVPAASQATAVKVHQRAEEESGVEV